MNEYEISLWEDVFVDSVPSKVYAVTTTNTPVKVINLDAHPEYYSDPYSARNNSAIYDKIPSEGAISGRTLYIFAKEIDKIKQLINEGVTSGTSDNLEFILSTTSAAPVRYVVCYPKSWRVSGNNIIFEHPANTSPEVTYFTISRTSSYYNNGATYPRFANYSEEQKIGIIGSHNMTSICRAEEPKLIEKLNGTHTFSFKMYYTYNEEGRKYQNPWINLLVNERKIKVKWNNKWYDFLIKNCDESSDSKSITYTCEDQFITELSKNGFNLEFAQELGNDQGTAVELVKQVLEDTDWSVAGDTIFPEEIEEPVYIVNTSAIRHTVVDIDEHPEYFYNPHAAEGTAAATKIPPTEASVKILIFYSQVQDLVAQAVNGVTSGSGLYLQFAYAPDSYQTDGTTSTLITNVHRYLTCWSKNWSYNTSTHILTIYNNDNPPKAFFSFNVQTGVSEYRAKRLVGSDKTAFDPLTKKYVSVFKANTNSHIAISGNVKPATYSKVSLESGYYHYFYSKESIDDGALQTYNITSGQATVGGVNQTLNQIYIADTNTDGDTFNLTWYYQNPKVSESLYKTNDTIYMYTESEYQMPDTVTNLLTNSNNFSDTTGWSNESSDGITWAGMLPTVSNWLSDDQHQLQYYPGQSYLELKASRDVRNNGILPSSEVFKDGFNLKDEFVLRVKLYTKNGDGTPISLKNTWPSGSDAAHKFRCRIRGADDTLYFNTLTNRARVVSVQNATDNWDWWIEYDLICYAAASQKTLQKNLIYADFRYAGSYNSVLIQDIQLFKKLTYTENGEEKIIYPGDLNKGSFIRTTYKYYNHTRNEEYNITDANKVVYIYTGYSPYTGSDFIQQHNEGNNKIRSIAVKESNRFNILQTIAETFEFWIRFEVDHDSNGKIIGNKRVVLKRDIGVDNGLGFIYGIDLKSITRKIQSDQIVTKTIVKPNSNEFAKNGFCTIARSEENYARSEFILNFDYYVSHGMLNSAQLNRDLYLSTGMGYFYTLRLLNVEYDNISDLLPNLLLEQDQLEALYEVNSHAKISAQEELTALKSEIIQLSGLDPSRYGYESPAVTKFIRSRADDESVKAKVATINELQKDINEYTTVIAQAEARLATIEPQIETIKVRQDEITEEKKTLDKTFYEKYSRFLSEGSWTNEEYIDDNLYYLDACSVAYTSSRPKVSYTINVIRVSSLKEFKNKVFHIGDIGFVQDTEFFGYTTINGIKTPYKEKILISEIAYNFEEPDKDTITVQNYKTQFDDLFQRITATTQSLQYASGEYALAAAQVQPGGGLTYEAIQTTLDLNTNLVYSALNQTITQDSTGITVSDQHDRNNMTKITSGGVFITTDGGLTWKNAIRGDGVATQWLSSGSVNTNKITILDGTQPAFRWDSQGINAFRSTNEGVQLGTFVRFDQYGIYGINDYNSGSDNDNYIPANESAIWSDAAFGMTWNGFFMKNRRGSHRVEISSTDDIQIVDTTNSPEKVVLRIGQLDSYYGFKVADLSGNEIVRIGELNSDTYGIRISDTSGPVMETGTDGNLWLKNTLIVGSGTQTSTVKIGYNPTETRPNTSAHQVFYAGTSQQEFIVYEDGFVKASGLQITNVGAFTIDEGGLKYDQDGVVLKFNPDGLTLINAALNIQSQVDGEDPVSVLQFVDGQLSVKGNITAENLSVREGTIGGFSITDNELISQQGESIYIVWEGDISEGVYYELRDNNYVITDDTAREAGKTYYTLQFNPAILLKGTDGAIYAKNITLGNNAQIEDYLKLGQQVYLYNPDLHDNDVLVVKNQGQDIVSLDSLGVMSFGNTKGIKIDGTLPAIYCGDLHSPVVSITPDLSKFTNVNISGKLMTTVFEVNKTQIVGGSMVFKPSYKINSITNNENTNDEITVEEDLSYLFIQVRDDELADGFIDGITYYELDENNIYYVTTDTDPQSDTTYYIFSYMGHYVQFLDEGGQLLDNIYPILGIVNNNTLLFEINSLINAYGLVVLGDLEETAVAIGINSGDSSNQFLEARGITITELTKTEDELANRTRVFLGDLNSVQSAFTDFGEALSGYGLVGDNVFLQGSLTTIVPDNIESPHTYAGINTVSNITATKFTNDNSHIVFWGGAASLSERAIQTAPFQVTEQGSLYASQGIFEGAILSRSKIIGAQLYTAEIHGWALNENTDDYTGSSAPLAFYNVDQGLTFNKCDYDNEDAPINVVKLFGIGSTGFYKNTNEYFLTITDTTVDFNGTSFTTQNNLRLSQTTLAIPSSVELNFDQTQLTVTVEDDIELQVKSQQISFGKNNMRYVAANTESMVIGYDLYITEGTNDVDTSNPHGNYDLDPVGTIDKPIIINPGGGITI